MDKVFCPYCGSEMEIEWDDFDFCAYTCPRCNSKAPRGDSIEDAEGKALQRPPQKPLTLEEAEKIKTVWLEHYPWIMEIAEACERDKVPLFMKESLRDLMGDDFRQEFPWEVK